MAEDISSRWEEIRKALKAKEQQDIFKKSIEEGTAGIPNLGQTMPSVGVSTPTSTTPTANPKGTGTKELAGAILQGTARSWLAAGQAITSGDTTTPFIQPAAGTKLGTLSRTLFGEGDISMKGEDVAFIGEEWSNKTGGFVSVGMVAADLLGGGGVKSLAKSLKAAKTLEEAAGLMKAAGFADDIAMDYGAIFAKTTNTKKIEKGLESAIDLQKGTKQTAQAASVKPSLSFTYQPKDLTDNVIWSKIFKNKTPEAAAETIINDATAAGAKLSPAQVKDIQETMRVNSTITDPKVAQVEIDKLYERINASHQSTPVTRTLGFNQGADLASAMSRESQILEKNLEYAKKGTGGMSPRQMSTTRFQFDAVQEQNFAKIIDALGLETKTVRTFKDLEMLAREIGSDPKTLAKTLHNNGSILKDSEVAAVGRVVQKENNTIVDLARDLKKANLEGRTEDVARLTREIDEATERFSVAANRLFKSSTEAGRSLNANKMLAKNIDDPAFWVLKATRILEKQGKVLTSDMAQTIIEMVDKRAVVDLAELIASLGKSTLGEQISTLWKAGLLSGIPTHLKNIGGSLLMHVLESVSDVAAVPADMLASLVTSKRTITYDAAGPAKKAMAFAKAIKGKEVKDYIRTGFYESDVLKKYDLKQINFGDSRMGKILNGYTTIVFRSLGTPDVVFKQTAIAYSLEQQARVIAKNEKLTGKAFKARVGELLASPTVVMQTNAIDAAEYVTFTSENVIAKSIAAMERGGASAIVRKTNEMRVSKGLEEVETTATAETFKAIMQWVFPFRNTPTNVAARLIDYSPVGFVGALYDLGRMAEAAKTGKPSAYTQHLQARMSKKIGRAITGTTVIAVGAYLAEQGVMTGNTPTNINERAQFYAEGKRALAVKVGDTWMQLSGFSPLGNLLGLGAEFAELSKEKGGLELLSSSAGAAVKSLTEQTFLKGLSGAVEALTDPEREAQTLIDSVVKSTVPNAIARATGLLDPNLRNPEKGDLLGQLATRIPGASRTQPVRRDVFGNPVKATTAGPLGYIDPFSATKDADNPVLNEARRVGQFIGMPEQSVKNFEMNNKEYDLYMQVVGPMTEEALTKLMSSGKYRRSDDEEKANLIKNTVAELRREANNELVPQIIIRSLDLPEGVSRKTITKAYATMSEDPKFKSASRDEQDKIIKELIEANI